MGALQQELKAKGERLDWAAYVPAHVPDEQNFIKTPLLQAWATGTGGHETRGDLSPTPPVPRMGRVVESQVGRNSIGQSAGALRTDHAQSPASLNPSAELLQALRGSNTIGRLRAPAQSRCSVRH